jgi:hypothetical protein
MINFMAHPAGVFTVGMQVYHSGFMWITRPKLWITGYFVWITRLIWRGNLCIKGCINPGFIHLCVWNTGVEGWIEVEYS